MNRYSPSSRPRLSSTCELKGRRRTPKGHCTVRNSHLRNSSHVFFRLGYALFDALSSANHEIEGRGWAGTRRLWWSRKVRKGRHKGVKWEFLGTDWNKFSARKKLTMLDNNMPVGQDRQLEREFLSEREAEVSVYIKEIILFFKWIIEAFTGAWIQTWTCYRHVKDSQNPIKNADVVDFNHNVFPSFSRLRCQWLNCYNPNLISSS